MSTIIITDEADGAQVRLEAPAERPRPGVGFGRKLRTRVTRYGGVNETSIQVLGDELDPIRMQGRWRDPQIGRGRTRELVRALEALVARGSLLRFEWADYQRWGFLEFTASWRLDDEADWELSFEPFYDTAPTFAPPTAAAPTPADVAAEVEDRLLELEGELRATPAGVSVGLAAQIITAVLEAQDRVAQLVTLAGATLSTTQLTGDVLRGALTSARSGYAAIQRAKRIAVSATDGQFGEGLGAIVGRTWAMEAGAKARGIAAALAELVRALSRELVPQAVRSHTLRDGETLIHLALRYFGDASAWTRIADANGIDSLTPGAGTVLSIPAAR